MEDIEQNFQNKKLVEKKTDKVWNDEVKRKKIKVEISLK